MKNLCYIPNGNGKRTAYTYIAQSTHYIRLYRTRPRTLFTHKHNQTHISNMKKIIKTTNISIETEENDNVFTVQASSVHFLTHTLTNVVLCTKCVYICRFKELFFIFATTAHTHTHLVHKKFSLFVKILKLSGLA